MKTLQGLIQTTPKEIFQRAYSGKAGCGARFLGKYIRQKNTVLVYQTGCDRKLDYITQVGVVKPELIFRSPVIVHCTCPMFTFYLEVVCARQGTSFLHNALPLFPKIKNPKGICYLCKHLVYILDSVKAKLQSSKKS